MRNMFLFLKKIDFNEDGEDGETRLIFKSPPCL